MPLSPASNEADACMVLQALPKLGPTGARILIEAFGGQAQDIFSASTGDLQAVPDISTAAISLIKNWQQRLGKEGLADIEANQALVAETGGMAYIPFSSPQYPPLLRQMYDPPVGIYTKGPLRPSTACVAIVGSRKTSPYGLEVAHQLAAHLAGAGMCIVSGMAKGIDTAAHKGALSVKGGQTAAIYGCGVNVCYPPENEVLAGNITARGVLVSEAPPNTHPTKGMFPKRNRIIAGMCMATIVVETDSKGGSLITARLAAEQGRQVFAVPGPIHSLTSRGCHQLIRDGATLLTSVEELLADLALAWPAEMQQAATPYAEAAAASGAHTQHTTGFISAKQTMPSAKKRSSALKRIGAGGSSENSAAAPAHASEPAKPKVAVNLSLLSETQRTLYTALNTNTALMPDSLVNSTGLPYHTVSATLVALEMEGYVHKTVEGAYTQG